MPSPPRTRVPVVRFGALACLVVACAFAGSASAQQQMSEIFARANAASARGEYDRAIAGYQKLIEAGVDDADVYYDLGTDYAKKGEYGRAILSFERALVQRPGDDGVERSLAAARQALGRRRAQQTGEAVVDAGPPFPEVLVRDVTEDTLAWSLLALDVLLFGLLLVRRFVRGDSARLALGVAAPVVAILVAASGLGLAVKKGVFREGSPGIVLEEGAALREGPDPRAAERGQAFEGERVRVLDREGSFVHVRLTDHQEGWLQASEVEAI